MKGIALVMLSALCATPLLADSGQHLIPAGSLISCTIAEPKISSKTTAIGDPVLCQAGHSERYGRSVLPYNSYLVGRFEDYKDPGHFVGKGWMELRFDRMVIEPDTVIPIDARVVDVPGYRVDNQGRILGKGHATRDAVMWSIPVLWPVDLITLPMRGPRPVLKEETRVMLKVMDDLAVPNNSAPTPDNNGLYRRQPTSDNVAPPAPAPDQQEPPQTAYADPQQDSQPPADQNADAAPAYADAAPAYPPPAPPVVYGYAPAPAYGYAVGPAYGIQSGYAYRSGYPSAYGYYRPGVRAYGYGGAPRVYAAGPGAYGRPYVGARPGFAGRPAYGAGYGARAGFAGRGGYGGGRASYGGRGGYGGRR